MSVLIYSLFCFEDSEGSSLEFHFVSHLYFQDKYTHVIMHVTVRLFSNDHNHMSVYFL